MTILNSQKIITGIKPIKSKPKLGHDSFKLKKDQPLNAYNFPMTKYTDYRIYGYKKDPFTGIKRPHWIRKRHPTGQPLEPKMVGLDGFFKVIPLNQVK